MLIVERGAGIAPPPLFARRPGWAESWTASHPLAVRVSVINVVSSFALFWFAVQADDLLADLSFQGGWQYVYWPGVFLATFFLWAFPVHYGARKTLDENSWIIQRATRDGLPAHCRDEIVAGVRERYGWAIEWVPRVLGVMPFVVLAVGIWGALGAIGGAQALDETRHAQVQLYTLYGLDAVAAIAFVAFVIKRKDWFPDWTGDVLHPVALLATGAIFVFAYVLPVWTAIHLPRALLVPPLFGSLVLFTSWLQRLGNRTGIPFLVALGLVAGVLTSLNADFDALRTLPVKASDPPQPDERLTIEDAVTHWKAANACASGQCPHPIVVAIDGGASRAAFTAATFVGELLDNVLPAPGEVPSPGRRLFAISGVSGGAYGAAVIQSALRDGQGGPVPGAPPCHSARSTWFGFDDWQKQGRTFTWRECLQALTSGDYLSPTIVGLAFRDFAAPPWQDVGLPVMADRAGLLEMTWQQHYSATLNPDLTWFLDGDRCATQAVNQLQGLCRPAAHPAAFVAAGKTWMPMLFLNGTSVETGRRIISADLRAAANTDPRSVNGGALYPQAYDLREAMSSPCPDVLPSTAEGEDVAYPVRRLVKAARDGKNEQTLLLGTCGGQPSQVDEPDVRLSTAALISARFPVISPAGIFGMTTKRYGDQVVDGGYFENSGITTALEIVAALRAQKLEPLLVSISNNPQLPGATEADIKTCAEKVDLRAGGGAIRQKLTQCSGVPPRLAPTPLLFGGYNTFLGRLFGLVWRPVQTLVGTGNGHADEAMGQAQAAFFKGGLFWLKVDVAPTFAQRPELPLAEDARCNKLTPDTQLIMAKVSMSWWLSAAVQADLDIQRCSLENRTQLGALIKAMKTRDAVLP